MRALTVLCNLAPPHTSNLVGTFWSHMSYFLVSVGQETLFIIPQMDHPQVQLQGSASLLPPSQHIMLSLHIYNDFLLTCLSKPSSWSIFSRKPSPGTPISFLHLFSHLLLPLFYPTPSWGVATSDQGQDYSTFLSPIGADHYSSTQQHTLKMAACWFQVSSSFQTTI